MMTESVKTKTSVQLRRTFAAPRERVFRAWTVPEMMAHWFHPNDKLRTVATVDLRPGGRYQIEMHPAEGPPYVVAGSYEVVEAPAKIVFTWQWANEEEPTPVTVVTVEFFERGPGQTEVVLTHERHANLTERDNHEQGWLGCFDMLDAYLSPA